MNFKQNMTIQRQDGTSCTTGSHVTRGERRILEMENHLKCLKDKLSFLESLVPGSVNDLQNSKIRIQEEQCQGSCSNFVNETVKRKRGEIVEKREDNPKCIIQSLAIKEKRLKEEIFNIESKEKKYMNALMKVKVNENVNEEVERPDDQTDLTQPDNSFPITRRRESGMREKILQLQEYSKKLCNCLKDIENDRNKILEKSRNLTEKIAGSEQDKERLVGFCRLEKTEEKEEEEEEEEDFPCKNLAKCNSCIICKCSEWEEDLEIYEKKNNNEKVREEDPAEKLKAVKKESQCKCYEWSSNSSLSLNSLEINNIYSRGVRIMHSDISTSTNTISSTDGNLLSESEKKKSEFSCYRNSEENCHKFCQECLNEWKRTNYSDKELQSDDEIEDCNFCDACNQERFRGGTDLTIEPRQLSHNFDLRQSLSVTVNEFSPELNKEMRVKHLNDNLEKILPVNGASQNSKVARQMSENNFCNEKQSELEVSSSSNKQKINSRVSQKESNIRREIIKKSRDCLVRLNPSKKKIDAAALLHQKKQKQSLNNSKLWNNERILTKDLAMGSLVLFLIVSSHLLGFNGFLSLSLLSRYLFWIISFPLRISIQIHKFLPAFKKIISEILHLSSKKFINIFQSGNLSHYSLRLFVFLLLRLIFLLFLLRIFFKFSFLKFNYSSDERHLQNQSKISIKMKVKNIAIFFLCPAILAVDFTKFLFHFPLLLLSTLIKFSFLNILWNFSYCVKKSLSTTFYILLTSRFSFWIISNFLFIIVGFLISKICNLNVSEISQDSSNQSSFFTILNHYSSLKTPTLEQTKNSDYSISEECFKLTFIVKTLNVILQSICECIKFIFRTFEIR